MQLKQGVVGTINIGVDLSPFDYEIGVYYTFMKCNWKDAFRELIDKHTFHEICSKGKYKYHPIAKDSLAKTKHVDLVKKEFVIKV